MKITVNAEPHDIPAANLCDALAQLGYSGRTVATALNGSFVSRDTRATTPIRDGDRIEVLAPRQGG
ncbi:sulfur carrier protein ThiS [Paracoccus aurantiacus]|uniref:Sulfur carrier protein ThiS n=1 Tax=Paracoccus aurantiacus TaxID=2599412 RepID=A0A5C6S1F6_9RHOB|nr:sulfur carrier protein ThiS [Paracoccus aurantiacus]TXB68213.1 sulfur carrier protein ThiS [Paracoccus aurantiacus]